MLLTRDIEEIPYRKTITKRFASISHQMNFGEKKHF